MLDPAPSAHGHGLRLPEREASRRRKIRFRSVQRSEQRLILIHGLCQSYGEADGRKLAGRLPGQKARQPSPRKNLEQLTHRRGPPASQTSTLQLTPPSLRHRAGQGAPVGSDGVTSRRFQSQSQSQCRCQWEQLVPGPRTLHVGWAPLLLPADARGDLGRLCTPTIINS